MDTTTVNYAIGKLSESWQSALPHLQNVGESYVQFIVAGAVLSFPFSLLAMGIAIASFRFFMRKTEEWEEGALIGIAFTFLCMVCCALFTVCAAYNAALALWNPEMFTVYHIISSCK